MTLNRTSRLAVAGSLAVAVLAGTLGAAVSAAAAPGRSPAAVAAPTPPAGTEEAAVGKLVAEADTSGVKSWQEFRITGRATGIPLGTELTLQQYRAAEKKWVPLAATTVVETGGHFGLRAKLGPKGVNKLRMAGGDTVSNTMKVTVR